MQHMGITRIVAFGEPVTPYATGKNVCLRWKNAVFVGPHSPVLHQQMEHSARETFRAQAFRRLKEAQMLPQDASTNAF